jgi:hypothetical protein
MEVEKNDVDISALFTWGRVFEVTNQEGNVESLVYMRLLGDADVNKARVHALRKSAELRRKLMDEDSDERLAYIKSIEELSLEDLKNYIIVLSMREITNASYKNIKVKKPVQPKSDASLAKQEKYQAELDEYPAKVRDAISVQMKKEVEALRETLASETKEGLYKKYVTTSIVELCEQEAINSYRNIEVYLGCYKDDEYKERYFSSLEEYDNLNTQVKIDFRAAFERLDIKMEELKKLREATL